MRLSFRWATWRGPPLPCELAAVPLDEPISHLYGGIDWNRHRLPENADANRERFPANDARMATRISHNQDFAALDGNWRRCAILTQLYFCPLQKFNAFASTP
jgi:hypothetical protein